MILEVTSVGLLAAVAYFAYFGSSGTPSTITEALNQATDNGYQFRDITYQDKPDLMHPDVRNNAGYTALAHDRGTNGVPRSHVRLIPGSSEILQLHRHENQYL